MRIAVVDAGGVRGGFGVALAKARADVTFIAGGAHQPHATGDEGVDGARSRSRQPARTALARREVVMYAMLKPYIMGPPN